MGGGGAGGRGEGRPGGGQGEGGGREGGGGGGVGGGGGGGEGGWVWGGPSRPHREQARSHGGTHSNVEASLLAMAVLQATDVPGWSLL